MIVLMVASLSCAACENESDAFKRGYAEGVKHGRETGYETGYKQGFEMARPGQPLALSGLASNLYRTLVLAGLLKLILSLLVASVSLLFRSRDGYELFGKSVLGVFGGVVAVLAAIFMGASDVALDVLLRPGGSVGARLIIVLLAAIGMYCAVEILFRIASSSHHRPWLDAWSFAVVAAFLSLLTPGAYFFWDKVPNATDYSGANLFLGVLLGGLFWISSAALNRRIAVLSEILAG